MRRWTRIAVAVAFVGLSVVVVPAASAADRLFEVETGAFQLVSDPTPDPDPVDPDYKWYDPKCGGFAKDVGLSVECGVDSSNRPSVLIRVVDVDFYHARSSTHFALCMMWDGQMYELGKTSGAADAPFRMVRPIKDAPLMSLEFWSASDTQNGLGCGQEQRRPTTLYVVPQGEERPQDPVDPTDPTDPQPDVVCTRFVSPTSSAAEGTLDLTWRWKGDVPLRGWRVTDAPAGSPPGSGEVLTAVPGGSPSSSGWYGLTAWEPPAGIVSVRVQVVGDASCYVDFPLTRGDDGTVVNPDDPDPVDPTDPTDTDPDCGGLDVLCWVKYLLIPDLDRVAEAVQPLSDTAMDRFPFALLPLTLDLLRDLEEVNTFYDSCIDGHQNGGNLELLGTADGCHKSILGTVRVDMLNEDTRHVWFMADGSAAAGLLHAARPVVTWFCIVAFYLPAVVIGIRAGFALVLENRGK